MKKYILNVLIPAVMVGAIGIIGAIGTIGMISMIGMIVCSETSFAAENLSYPELMVVPKASERLQMEAQQESNQRWTRHLMIQVSALSTILSASIAHRGPDDKVLAEDFEWAQRANFIVGGLWLGATLYSSASYRPYGRGYNEVKGLPYKTMSEQLTKERLSEEVLLEAGSLGDRMMWLSLVTQLAVNANLASRSDRIGQVAGGISILLSVAPLMFTSNWQQVRNYHLDYKRKIFAPVVGLGPKGTAVLAWNFNF